MRQSLDSGHLETFLINSPRNGYYHRAQATATNSAGASVNVSEITTLPLRGTGLNVVWIPQAAYAMGIPVGGCSAPRPRKI